MLNKFPPFFNISAMALIIFFGQIIGNVRILTHWAKRYRPVLTHVRIRYISIADRQRAELTNFYRNGHSCRFSCRVENVLFSYYHEIVVRLSKYVFVFVLFWILWRFFCPLHNSKSRNFYVLLFKNYHPTNSCWPKIVLKSHRYFYGITLSSTLEAF